MGRESAGVMVEPSSGSTAATFDGAVDTLSRGEALGRYIVIERLGAGATGVVYAAYDPELDRKVAIKILRPQADSADEGRRQARFVREGKAIAKLAHPNVVGIFDVGVAEGRAFLAMEYLAGGTLNQWLAAQKRSWRDIMKMFVEVGRGLAAAHGEGLVHRDFKPDNVLLDRAGTPKVADFGLVRQAGAGAQGEEAEVDDPRLTSSGIEYPPSGPHPSSGAHAVAGPLTRTGTLAGTPAYMAPEQFRGLPTDGRTDQFAFCVALHEALYGRRPFDAETVFDLAEAVMREQILPAPKGSNVPGWIRRSLVRGLRADPAQRYEKLEDLLATLEADPVARVRKVAVGAIVGLLLVATFAGLYRRSERRRVEFEGRVATKLTEGRQALAQAEAMKQRLAQARDRAFAAFDFARRDEGESWWAEARAVAFKLEATLKRAQSGLEAALTLDQANEAAKEALGAAVFQRAWLAELEFRKADLARHLEHLERVDRSGGLMARWTQPGSVEIRTTPAGARLVLERYEAGDDTSGRLRAVTVGEPFFASAAGARPLPPGSYRVTATLDGFAPTRLPFVIQRGQALRLDLRLPASNEVPAGFIHVPAGRFLYGDVDEDWRVAYLNAVPIHERTTGAFFIKAHETTFGEWLEFLRDLPPAERRVRTPSSVIVQGGVAVKGSPETGWSLELKVSGGKTLTARQGSPLLFPGRTLRASQDWLRMPVIGVSQRDMQAYIEWLARTGRVRGARFCSEVEWERAARGADERPYPSSQRRLDRDDANIDETYGRVPGTFGPDEVGAHPASESPFGIQDMAGNVWEVVRSGEDEAAFTIRGGSYYQQFISARATNREPVDLETKTFLVGFRVCGASK
jgi:formylglycine-generating enzyme required for sulfatase activity/tRNA A-37 threonylcarbamoyl transferase component Bud32